MGGRKAGVVRDELVDALTGHPEQLRYIWRRQQLRRIRGERLRFQDRRDAHANIDHLGVLIAADHRRQLGDGGDRLASDVDRRPSSHIEGDHHSRRTGQARDGRVVTVGHIDRASGSVSGSSSRPASTTRTTHSRAITNLPSYGGRVVPSWTEQARRARTGVPP